MHQGVQCVKRSLSVPLCVFKESPKPKLPSRDWLPRKVDVIADVDHGGKKWEVDSSRVLLMLPQMST